MKFKDNMGNTYETNNPITIELMKESDAYVEVKEEKEKEEEKEEKKETSNKK